MNRLLAQSAEEWGITRRLATGIFWIPIVGAVIMALARIDKGLYRFLLEDDGPVEWVQFSCFIIAGVAGAGIAIRRWRAGYRWQGLLFVGFALAMFFVTGEEIAWGQRILGLETPEELLVINKQEEITLHNIGEILDVFNLTMMMIGGFGAVAYFLNRVARLEQWWDQVNYLMVPPFFLIPSFLVMFLYKLVRFTVLTESGFTITKYGEWAEFCLAFGLCIFAWLNYRRLAVKPAPVLSELAAPSISLK